MPEERETRLRRLRYRAGRRGTREMDLLLGRFAEHALEGMTERQLRQFEDLLGYPDPLLQTWIVRDSDEPAGEFMELITGIRSFHAR